MQFGSYQVLFELGRGGMGTVYLGRVRGTGDFERLVAIKRQHAPEAGFAEPPELFLSEARLAGLVHHANVVGMHQAGRDAEGYYFVCDYVEGLSLAGLVARQVPHPAWPLAIVTRVMLDALAGLQAVHDAVDAEGNPLGVLHRDVAVDNLLVGRDGVTRLADFGIAKTARGAPLTGEGMIRGKLPYLAPEYLRGEPLDRTFDLYAAGVTLWVALAGRLPWGDRSEVHMMQCIVSHGVPSLPKESVASGSALEAVIARACHARRSERFQSAREMLDALESAAPIARHVQVAEYVEQVAGVELAERRARVLALRRTLDAGAKPSATIPRVKGSDAPTVPMRVATIQGIAPPVSRIAPTPAARELRFTPPDPKPRVLRFTPPDPIPVRAPATSPERPLARRARARSRVALYVLPVLAMVCLVLAISILRR